MNYFDGFHDNTVIRIQKNGTPPIIIYSENRTSEETLERLENYLVNDGIEKVLQLLPEYCHPSITHSNPKNDPNEIYNETILTWNPNLLLILDKSTKLVDSKGIKGFKPNEFWKMVPTILEEKKSDLEEMFQGEYEIQSLLSQYIGFYGYLSYEAGRHLESYETRGHNEIIPTCIFSFPYNYIIERENDFLYIEFRGPVVGISDININLSFPQTDYIASSLDYETYTEKINSITEYIVAGDIYQANFTQRFVISKDKIQKSSREIFFDLIKKNPVRHSGYLEYTDLNILSVSPELFLSIKNGKVLTKPIKGTRPRGHDPEDDKRMIDELINSDKDQAELAMIVDLLRNDLGKSAKSGSVEVEKHAAIESYSNVHHLVSSVTADIEPDLQSSWRLLLRAFPGGSITGCPKIRSMEIIEELEAHPRGVYTGSIGYLALNGNMQFNIAIRTITMTQDVIIFNAGGGIVFDSDPADEYIESLHKATHLASYFDHTFIGNISWVDGKFVMKNTLEKGSLRSEDGFFETISVRNSRIQNLGLHRDRIQKGVDYYKIEPSLPEEHEIYTLIKLNLAVNARIRISVNIENNSAITTMEIFPYAITNEPLKLLLDDKEFEYLEIVNHGVKPTNYKKYMEKTDYALNLDCWDMLLFDDLGNLLETGRSNIYFYLDKWYTPSQNCVQGIMRQKLLNKKLVFKRNLQIKDLSRVKGFAVSNALIGVKLVNQITNKMHEIIWKFDENNLKGNFNELYQQDYFE